MPGDGGLIDPSRSLRRIQRHETHSALNFILSDGGRPAETEHILDFLAHALHRGIDTSAIWIAEDGRRMLWAILPIVSPGRTVLLMGPRFRPLSWQYPAARALTDRVVAVYRQQGVQLAQVLLEPPDMPVAHLYESCGFVRMADLIFLQGRIPRALPTPTLGAGLALHIYSSQTHDLFVRAILGSYEASLDCPVLNGVRRIDDIIDGHKAAGEHDPGLWFVLTDGDSPAGVLLLSPVAMNETIELVYLGLTPGARGRGLGHLLMELALSCCWQRKCATLSLAVDAINTPALKLYHRHGMKQVALKTALMRDLREKTPEPELQPTKSDRRLGSEI